ncbi:DUF2917 domain-containing protein [Diaphorobacter caeni]|uniref:DUF2917 domain-containing protein n=1 Tax=Diaphorobacter caeni TaxID=2784387 RepID=UPI00188E003D|nr:DUF2917 domain-containing protein [Diaphorobacter caeni]MBF5003952.1 DUF2917 domain-containing protein [Diaphorobacter caeni]
MTTAHVPVTQQWSLSRSQPSVPSERVEFFETNILRSGLAASLRSREPMRLRLLASSGHAWITLTAVGAERSEDLFLFAGQMLDVAPGRHLVLEPVAGQAVRFAWERRTTELAGGG